MRVDRAVVAATARLEITGDLSAELRDKPLLLAANHIGNVDVLVLLAACQRRGIAVRFLATGGLFDIPVLGRILRQSGSIRADRHTKSATAALRHVVDALGDDQRPVLVYPEGRVCLEAGIWPERGKTGVARMALAADVPVVPVSQWGAHELMCYGKPLADNALNVLPMIASWLRAVRRRPTLKVHFGTPVDLTDLSADRPGDATRARDRIMRAISAGLAPLRATEPDGPHHRDPTRPVSGKRSPWR
ncbi:1-acyl-sn-glycerol-3-phosphate acyltransferase [Saccharopolyspora lacisalsi]|uniref:1-acyl-sn-glycerol-3-phosphate acyltransferase n=1 Tax=Halosaccharopolyspora lacisalsi TaxID=1000566 RepID=A0A839DW41_9PSEU|nr:lysophospholipid acyltransferase family protein [Halosaccharopolyspora lacisalsi]MBA8823391.1 1-acyl-sn-glycerol-3-phosphate acyltransferase [Halosaccharopolyspora lacisalsi]